MRSLPSSLADWMNSRPFEITGDELPRPGISTLCRMSPTPNDVSAFGSSAIPLPLGPRKRAQSAAMSEVARSRIARRVRMAEGSQKEGVTEEIIGESWRRASALSLTALALIHSRHENHRRQIDPAARRHPRYRLARRD